MLMLIWNNIARRRTQSVITVTITTLTIFVFVMVMGIFQVVTEGLALSRERLGADAILVPKYASASGSDLLFTALPENIYMEADVLEQAKQLEGVAALTPQFYNQTLDLSCCDAGTTRRIVGYDAETDFILTPYLEESDKKHWSPAN
jgi:putative ABC transport system permease protein